MQAVRVIVVGAGASGIATASRLLENGFTNITVLEAENRIGGRIHTENFADGIVDMGAQWVHGEEGNVVFQMANPRNLLTESITSLFDSTTVYVESSGRAFRFQEMPDVFEILSNIDKDSKIFFKTNTGSVGDYFISDILDWYEKLENSIDASDSWFETSGHGLTQYWDCEGNLLWSWKSGGYKTVLDLLMKKDLTEKKDPPLLAKIHLNKQVKNITWDHLIGDKEGKVVVLCSDGSSYVADHVVVTVSLGVLKEMANSLFSPPLPEEKLVSIKQTRDKSWLEGVFGFWALDNQPLVLYTWAVGSQGKHMEQLTESEVAQDLMELLNKYLGKQYNIPQPDEIKRSTWMSNPHFHGSYSFRSMESDRLHATASQLARPVLNSSGKEVLLFAGEASHDHYYSTVHGAIETGWREADRLLKHYRQFNTYKAVIIGAGISGLAAAKTLLEGGFNKILLLEAQDRPGGRILSLPYENGWLEAGAQWIHGQNSAVWRLANQFGLLSDVISAEGEGLYLREDGVLIEPRIVHEVYSVVSDILEECESLVNRNSFDEDVPKSIGHHLKQRFIEYLENCDSDTEDVKNMKYEVYDWHVRFQVIDNSCTVLDKLSARAWGKYNFCGGTDYVNFKGGYSSLIRSIVETLPHGVLKLQCPVKRISWKNVSDNSSKKESEEKIKSKNDLNGEECEKSNLNSDCIKDNSDRNIHLKSKNDQDKTECLVKIDCEDGTSVYADHVIITCSLGYLKENYKKMFSPELPDKICKAIEDLGFATINKIYLAYEEPWWDKDTKGFQLIWLKNHTNESDYSEAAAWTRDLTGFDVLPNHKAVLLGWVGGRGAELVENFSETEIAIHCTELLRTFTQQANIPKPHKVIRTSWYGNPYIRGAYSNTSISCDVSKVGPSTLSDPVYAETSPINSSFSTEQRPVLLFAGEATHETHFSTTHGAFESGQKQAEVILAYNQLHSKL
ncbi:Protein anon-37Cs [Gryllus bimaculatus]|nr:Protein anon-37Cs [Gryllus bimaculatus]